jgi:uncharacterized protein (DUF58 family)
VGVELRRGMKHSTKSTAMVQLFLICFYFHIFLHLLLFLLLLWGAITISSLKADYFPELIFVKSKLKIFSFDIVKNNFSILIWDDILKKTLANEDLQEVVTRLAWTEEFEDLLDTMVSWNCSCLWKEK